METFSLTLAEFSAVAVFLNARTIPGLNVDLASLTDEQVVATRQELVAHGWMVAGDQPNTWHLNEALVLAMTVVAAPENVILVRDVKGSRSIQFFVAGDGISMVVVSEDSVLVAAIENPEQLGQEAIRFLDGTEEGLLAAATVEKSELVGGFRAKISGSKLLMETGPQPLTPQTVALFLGSVLPVPDAPTP